MARGWESKAIEQQQVEAERSRHTMQKAPVTPDDREREQRRGQLALALKWTETELKTATRSQHREMLQLRLASIKSELDALS
jgi:hypothetical protein